MHSADINKTREILGKQKTTLLKNIFEALNGLPPMTDKARYRANHVNQILLLDELEHKDHFIRATQDNKSYRLSPYALPLIESDRSKALINIMSQIYLLLREHYNLHLSEKAISSREILEQFEHSENDILEALYYLSETHGIWSGLSNGFPYQKDSTITVSESVIIKNSLIEVLTEFYRWHYLNPREELTTQNIENLFTHKETSNLRFFSAEDSSTHPVWFEELTGSEKALIIEIDTALQCDLKALPIMGIRALLENIMVSRIEDSGTFRAHLNKFHEKGFITKQHAGLLERVIDVGSAAMHRAHFPSKEELQTCLDVIKYLMHGLYVLKPKVDVLEACTPQRKPSSKT